MRGSYHDCKSFAMAEGIVLCGNDRKIGRGKQAEKEKKEQEREEEKAPDRQRAQESTAVSKGEGQSVSVVLGWFVAPVHNSPFHTRL